MWTKEDHNGKTYWRHESGALYDPESGWLQSANGTEEYLTGEERALVEAQLGGGEGITTADPNGGGDGITTDDPNPPFIQYSTPFHLPTVVPVPAPTFPSWTLPLEAFLHDS